MTNNNMIFDNNTNLFGCDNGVYDIEEDKFRDYKYDDFVTMSCGYDFIDYRLQDGETPKENYDFEKMNDLANIMEKIHPNTQICDLVWSILASGVSGKCIEKFFVFNGDGSNGKGWTNEFMSIVLGDYYYNVDTSVITQKKKETKGTDPETAAIHKKRYIVMSEPSKHTPIENSSMKNLTGGGVIKARMNYSNDTVVELNNTTVMETNDRPKLREDPTNGDIRRIVDIHFGSTFTDDINNVDEKENVYYADAMIKEKKWKDEHKFYMLNMLFVYLQQLKRLDYKFTTLIPKSVVERTEEYLKQCYDLHAVFLEEFEEDDTENAFVKLKEVVSTIKASASFKELPKFKQVSYNVESIKKFFTTNKIHKKRYKEKLRIKTDNKERDIRSVLLGWKLKIQEEEKDEDKIIIFII
jgi:phage/plasmid-associated DNA primase